MSGVANADRSVIAFKGSPYAAPPVGDLRWRAPKPAATWTGVKQADRCSASCTQRASGPFGPFTKEFIYVTPPAEDCLYLNVWAPAKGASKRPVLVYIHGGGYDSGSGDVPIYRYLFDHALPGPDSARLGAFHTVEVPYTMNTLHAAPERPFADADGKIGDLLVS